MAEAKTRSKKADISVEMSKAKDTKRMTAFAVLEADFETAEARNIYIDKEAAKGHERIRVDITFLD